MRWTPVCLHIEPYQPRTRSEFAFASHLQNLRCDALARRRRPSRNARAPNVRRRVRSRVSTCASTIPMPPRPAQPSLPRAQADTDVTRRCDHRRRGTCAYRPSIPFADGLPAGSSHAAPVRVPFSPALTLSLLPVAHPRASRGPADMSQPNVDWRRGERHD